MSINILMPALSPTMEKGNLARWLVKEGDKISAGDVIAEIETDKAIMEFESIEDGIVGKILIPAGTHDVAVNTPVAILLEPGETLQKITSENQGITKSLSKDSEKEISEKDKSSHITSQSSFPGVSLINHSLMIASDSIVSEEEWNGATRSLSVREALCEAMAEEMRCDPDVFIMGEEVAEYQGSYKVTKGLLQEFGPKRVIDTPITEYGFAGLGCGAAFFGLKPIVEFMTFNFSMQAIDHVINTAGKTLYMSGGQVNVPIVFRGPNGAASRVAAQHSQCYASWYAHCPGIKVVSPYSASDAKGLLKSAIRDLNPVIFLENELLYGDVGEVPDSKDWIVPLGKAKIVRSGSDVTVVTFSIMVGRCMEAAQHLSNEGINVEIIDLRTLRPLDWHTIVKSLQKTNRLIIAEEGWPYAGIGSAISALVAEHALDLLDSPILRITGKDVLLPYASNLESLALPQVEDVVRAIRYVCYKES